MGRLGELEHLNLRHNLFKSLPGTICNLQKLEFLDASENQLRRLPGKLHKAEALIEVRATHNKIKSPPGKLGAAPHIEKARLQAGSILQDILQMNHHNAHDKQTKCTQIYNYTTKRILKLYKLQVVC